MVILTEDGRGERVVLAEWMRKSTQLHTFAARVGELLDQYHPDFVFCEQPWTCRNDPRPSIALGQREKQGIVIVCCKVRRIRFGHAKPWDWKRAAGLKGNAGKEAIRNEARVLLGVEVPEEQQDVCDASLIALVGLNRLRGQRREREWRRQEQAEKRKRKKELAAMGKGAASGTSG